MELSVAQISERLSAQAQTVAAMLLPGGKLVNSREWVCGDITGAPGESLKVCVYGQYSGHWQDWSTDTDKGDLIDLWRCVKGCTQAEAIKQAKQWLGIVDSVKVQEQKFYSKPPTINSAFLQDNGIAMKYLRESRKLSVDVIKALKIEGCKEKQAIVFPCYSPGGELINRSYRTLGENKKVWQDKECAPSLFGWQALPKEAYAKRTVLLSEGQIDCATWLQWGIPALSIPNGTGCAWIDYEWDNLAPFDTFYLAFDQDEAGRKITETVMSRLGKHRCLIVSLPKKDANDCLKAGYDSNDAQDWIKAAKPPKIKRLITAAEMESRLIAELRFKEEAFTLPMFAGDWPYSGFYFRPGEVTLWGGFSHAGKTTLLNFMKSVLLANQSRIFDASMEMKVETTLRKLAKIFLNERLNEETAKQFVKGVGENLVYADVVGSLKQDELMEMMWFSHRRYGCTHFLIDSLMRIQDLEEDYPAQGEFCNRLQDFAKETGGHVHLVAHLGKPSQVVDRPSMYSIKGSSLLVNNADNVLLVCRNPEKEKLRKASKLTDEQDKNMHDTEVIVEKQRETGWLHTFKLKFDPLRYSYRKF
jgi:twinkle protein